MQRRRQSRRAAPSRAPIKRPVSASAAYAKPSFIYEKSVKSCSSRVFTASSAALSMRAEAPVKKVYTATMQNVRSMMSRLMTKNVLSGFMFITSAQSMSVSIPR